MSYTLKIYQDKELKKEFTGSRDGGEAFGWLLRNQHLSVDSALRWGGWKVEQINEQTKEMRVMERFLKNKFDLEEESIIDFDKIKKNVDRESEKELNS